MTVDATFDRIVRAHGESLSRVAWGYARDDADHDDLMQEILVAIWRALPRFRGESSERTFVFRIAHNRGCTNSSRTKRRRADEPESIPDSIADQRPGPDEETDRALMRSRLVAAVRTLPELPRQAVLLRLEGFSIAEIAALQETSENNVSVRLTRARDRLSELLGGGGQ